MIVFFALLAGVVLGVWSGVVWTDARRMHAVNKAALDRKGLDAEIKRLRTQVATLIGKETT